MELSVYEPFKNLIPPLQQTEYQFLERNILRDGCTTPIDYWKRNGENVIVDGHNRHEICKKHGISFETHEIHFENDDEAKIWIIEKQFGRRNLSNFQRAELALLYEPMIAAKARERQATSTGGSNPQLRENSHEAENGRTDETIAKIAGISSNTIRRAKVIKERGTPEQIERARIGGRQEDGRSNSVNAIYTEIRHDGIEKKTCHMCGNTLPIDRFYGEGATCKTCTEKRKQVLLSGGTVLYKQTGEIVGGKSNPGRSSEIRERDEIISSVVSELYDQNRTVIHTVDHLLEDLESITKDFIGKVNRSIEIFKQTLDEDGAKGKVLSLLNGTEQEIAEIRRKLL